MRLRTAGVVLSSLMVLSLASQAGAALFPSAPFAEEFSDLTISFVEGSYDASTGEFELSGTAGSLDIGPGSAAGFSFFTAPATLTGLTIDSATGEVLTPGTLTVTLATSAPAGAPLPGGAASILTIPGVDLNDTLLSADVFGIEIVQPTSIQLVGRGVGGELADDFVDPAAGLPLIGISLSGGTLGGGLPADFSTSFSFSSASINVIGPIPEPGSLALFATALAAAALRRKVA